MNSLPTEKQVSFSRRRLTMLAPLALICAALFPADAAFAQDYSGSCTSPTAKVADGYAGSTFVSLRVQSVDTDNAWICYRVSNGGSVQIGGRIDVIGGQAPTQPTDVDADSGACLDAEATNTVPLEHPTVLGHILGDPFFVDVYSDPDEASVCVGVESGGGFDQRAVVSLEGSDPPEVVPHQDSPDLPLPGPLLPPSGYPSGTCQSGAVGTPQQFVNADVGVEHVFLYTAQPSSTRAHICARVQGPMVSGGGMLTIDTNGSPGVGVILPSDSETDLSPCTFPIVGLVNPVTVNLSMSPPGANPASVCVIAGGTQRRATFGVTGSPTVPTAIPAFDPDTPLL